MQFFYDGQIRRYLLQTIRAFSNFVVKYGDGTLVRVPVVYGDPDRQVATIMKQNSENAISSCPKIAVYISGLEQDASRLADATHIGKMHFRERDFTGSAYTQGEGRNYTVERLMPSPFKLTMKVDIWSSSTEQKLQIIEQILVLFNPTLEIQTTDNYIDWTSLSTLSISAMNWSSRQVPVGTSDAIDIANITLTTPIWISPPVKIKHLGVITSIINNIYDGAQSDANTYIDGLGQPLGDATLTEGTLLTSQITTITDFQVQVYGTQGFLMPATQSVVPREPTLDIAQRQGPGVDWFEMLSQYPGKYIAGVSKIMLIQPSGVMVVGTFAVNSVDATQIQIVWDKDTLPTNTNVDSQGIIYPNMSYGTGTQYRSSSPGTFDAIVNPLTYNPKRPTGQEQTDQTVATGMRFLLIEDIGATVNTDGADAWKSTGGADLIAHANDIVEWTGSAWTIVFNSALESNVIVYQTNIYTGVQYIWNGVYWAKSFEGEYHAGKWKLEL